MSYNLTFMDTSNNIFEYTAGINTSSNGILIYWLLVIIWIIVFISMKNFDTKVVFLSSSLITSLVSILFFALSWIDVIGIIIPIMLTMFSLLAFWLSRN